MSEQVAPKAKNRNVQIKTLHGKCFVANVNIVAGKNGRLYPGDVCEVPAEVAETLEDFELVEFTRATPNCKLVGSQVIRNG